MADQPAETVPILEEVEVESTIFVLSFLPLDLAFAIIQGIIDGEEAQTSKRAQLTSSGLASSSIVPWNISNRYYTASVDFHARVISDGDAHIVPDEMPAVIVLANQARPPTEVSSLLKRLSANEPDVCICIGVDSPGAQSATVVQELDDADDEAREQEWADMCLDHGFEYIDQSDLARAREALQIHSWPSMTPSKPSGSTKSLHSGRGGQRTVTGDNGFDDDFAPFVSATSGQDLLEGTTDVADQGDDPQLVNLERIFSSLQGLRAQAEGMNDADRRAFAAKVALQFSQGLGDDSDSDTT